MDHLSKEKRSWNMSRIKDKNTSPELAVQKILKLYKIYFKTNSSNIIGKPDIVLKKYKILVFVNGCFWHGHGCKRGNTPKTNKGYWNSKILGNVKRDKKNYSLLKKKGWRIVTIWECDLKDNKKISKKINQILKYKHNYLKPSLSDSF